MPTNPAALEAEIDQLEREYQQLHAALRRPDGSAVYSETEQRDREQAIRVGFSKAVTSINERIDAIVTEAESELTTVAATDPTARLSASELERISLRTPIVLEDLRHQPEAVQVARLRAALTSGDMGERYVAVRVGRALIHERDRGREQERGVAGLRDGRPIPSGPDYSELASVVKDLEAAFIDAPRRQRAEQRIAAAQSVTLKLAEMRYHIEHYGPRPTRATITTW